MSDQTNFAQRVLILGGYGRAGYEIANLLSIHTTLEITLAGHHLESAKSAATELNRTRSINRIKAAFVDMNQRQSVREAFATCDLVIVTAPFKKKAAQIVVEAAVSAGIDYIDINTDLTKHKVLAAQHERIHQGQQIFLTEAGIIPGCPAVMVRWAIEQFDSLKSVTISSLMREPRMPSGSIYDIIAHGNKSAYFYSQGEWHQVSPFRIRLINFGQPFGSSFCIPVALPELKLLPKQERLETLRIYQAGFNLAVNLIFLLLQMTGLSRFKRGNTWGVKLFEWANQRFTNPPYGITVILTSQDQTLLKLYHPNVYRGTAIPVVAAVQQILDGKIERPWQGFMGQGVLPTDFIDTLPKLGLRVERNERSW